MRIGLPLFSFMLWHLLSNLFCWSCRKRVQQRLALYQGVCPVYMDFSDDAEETFRRALDFLQVTFELFWVRNTSNKWHDKWWFELILKSSYGFPPLIPSGKLLHSRSVYGSIHAYNTLKMELCVKNLATGVCQWFLLYWPMEISIDSIN